MDTKAAPDRQAAALLELAQFPLLAALYGRRARRISLGSTIPDGPLAYESPHEPVPLTELERMVVLTYMFPTRDAGALVDPSDEEITVELMLARHASRIVKLDDKRIEFPREEPYYEGHNTWCVNVPGSLLAFAVGDLAQHTLAGMMFL